MQDGDTLAIRSHLIAVILRLTSFSKVSRTYSRTTPIIKVKSPEYKIKLINIE